MRAGSAAPRRHRANVELELGGAGRSSGQPPAKAMLQKYLQTTASGRMHEAEAVLQLVAEGHDDNRPHAGVRLPRALRSLQGSLVSRRDACMKARPLSSHL
jgi:hypothetical protein